MCKFNIKRLSLMLTAVLGFVLLSGCSNMGPQPVYRAYYQDRACKIYYVDYNGNRVYTWNARAVHEKDFRDAHVNMHGDPDGNYVDNLGNQIFRERTCD